jgi:hypothetical protein
MSLLIKTVPARPQTATFWAQTIDSALLAPHEGAPSLAHALTRLQYLDESIVKVAEWEELHWLIGEARHIQEKRGRKHPLLKWGPRAKLLQRCNHFLLRGAIKQAAILSALERWSLRLRGRREESGTAARQPVDPMALSRLLNLARGLQRQVETPPSTEEIAQFLGAQIVLFETLLRDWEPSVFASAEGSAPWDHFTWHAREAAGAPVSWWKERMVRKCERVRWTIIALELGETFLLQLQRSLRRAEVGVLEGSEIAEIS